jgi:hypothetical protein
MMTVFTKPSSKSPLLPSLSLAVLAAVALSSVAFSPAQAAPSDREPFYKWSPQYFYLPRERESAFGDAIPQRVSSVSPFLYGCK